MATEQTFELDTIADAVAAVAETATPERIAFMIRHTSGMVCAPMARDRAERLHLLPIVANNLDPMRTASR